VTEERLLGAHAVPKDAPDARDDEGGDSPSSSAFEENANPKSHTPVRQTVYRTEVYPSSRQHPMLDLSVPIAVYFPLGLVAPKPPSDARVTRAEPFAPSTMKRGRTALVSQVPF